MADVASTLRAWSATEGSNAPSGSTVIGSGLDDNLRTIQAVLRKYLASPGSNMASASTVDLSTADGYYIQITGTTTITGFGTESAGVHYVLRFAGALTLTHNGTSLILPGGVDITTVAGDIAWMVSEGSGNWRCLHYSGAGTTTQPGVLELLTTAEVQTGTDTTRAMTAAAFRGGAIVQQSTVTASSGSQKDFTSIPSWAKRITVQFNAVSTNGTAAILIQIGDSGGLSSSGYDAYAGGANTTNVVNVTNHTNGYSINNTNLALANDAHTGSVVLTKMEGGHTWVAQGVISTGGSNVGVVMITGKKTLSNALDRLTVVTTDTFDGSGVIGLSYE